MTNLTAAQEQEVTFLTGINADGTQAAQSFASWTGEVDPVTYSSISSQAKWGAPIAGTGGVVTVAFAPGEWSTMETQAFTAAMHLWSEVANISFTVTTNLSAAGLVIGRGNDGMAYNEFTASIDGVEGTPTLGSAIATHISIDTSVEGFGPIGGGLDTIGGYAWMTITHELGHAIGLGHGGLYNGEGSRPMLTPYDATAWTLMSYVPGDSFYEPGVGGFGWGRTPTGDAYVANTPMPLDIVAVQRIYGLPVTTPLSGGQVFGFHSNIQGDTAQFFDFTINTHPVVTLFDLGTGNTLDLSGYNVVSDVDLHDGAFSSVGGMQHNIAIAYGTRIDTAIGGTYTDAITANDNGDVLMGNIGADILKGGTGNDHIYGNMAASVQGMIDGNDTIDAGDGSNYVNGNGGNDIITAGQGTNRLYGGAGNDMLTITGTGSGHLNGNMGDDLLQVTGGSNDVHGGQGNDQIIALGGDNFLFGDAGNDVISGGTGVDVMTGGAGADLFVLIAPLGKPTSPAGTYDEVVDYTDGIDKLHVNAFNGTMIPTVLHAANGASFADFAAAQAYATTLIAAMTTPTNAVAALAVGSDTFLFYNDLGWPGGAVDSAVRIDRVAASTIDASDFSASADHF